MKEYTKEELAVIIEKHGKWLKNENGGERADLQSANLQSADLRSANLQYANLRSANLQSADLQYADLRSANLQSANLQSADLRSANLRSANLDFSMLPMWCGGSRFKCSPALIRQIFAHVCTMEVYEADEELKTAIASILEEAKKSHRAGDLGIL